MDYYAFLGGDEFGLKKDRRGEFYLYQIRQILARYYLERLSNGLGEIPEFNFWEPLETGYYSSLTFFNGVNFPSRSNYYMMYLNKGKLDLLGDDKFLKLVQQTIRQSTLPRPSL